uniref:Ion transport domain-containing protein n=1 Tax=Ditylenchus dipsaci TaxID=166011 RepID=A0A915EF33_9BILA
MRKAFSTASASGRKFTRLQRQACISVDSFSDGIEKDWIGVAPLLDMQGTARILACKAATISSAMLATQRKVSVNPGLPLNVGASGGSNSAEKVQYTGAGTGVGGVASSRVQAARESVAVFAEMLSMDAAVNKQKMSDDIVCMGLFEFFLKLACVFSMVSVCLHTPQTIAILPSLQYILFVIDFLVTSFFTVEALLKTNTKTIRDRWCQFDLALLFFHYLSMVFHTYELITVLFPQLGFVYASWYGVVRSPRPFIMVRLIRSVLRFKLPKNRIQQIIKRSSQQIQNVTIFFLFFMALYAIMGVQLFGRMEYHCVLPGTNPKNVTIADLAIPDTMCSKQGLGGYECPNNMICMKLDLSSHQNGFYGMFNDFGSSLFTVYMAASQEGWVYVLYDCLDTFPSYVAFFYFITLIFFLAWLVKNVFIAVITETFAEIRVQFSEMWQARETTADDNLHSQLKLRKNEEGNWHLITVDSEIQPQSTHAPVFLSKMVRTTLFQMVMMILVLLNALINASFVYRHDKSDEERKVVYYYIEVAFTILFLAEFLVKMIGLTWLIKASPMLEDFVYKIFGPGKKLGGLVFFTMILLIITSAVSLQLYCYVEKLDKFRTFPQAFMSMFQIITQEGWTDVVVEILRSTNDSMVPFVVRLGYLFVGYHLFVTLIVLSLFVAVILDNLEMDEELKKIKQLKVREETTCMKTTLPWRLRIFEQFPTRPQMVKLRKMPKMREFPMPKVRDSFTRQFFDTETDHSGIYREDFYITNKRLLGHQPNLRSDLYDFRARQIGQMTSKFSLNCLIEESNKNRVLLSDSTQLIAQRAAIGTRSGKRDYSIRNRQRGFSNNNSLKTLLQKRFETDEIDIKALQQKRAQAEFTRNRIEEEMRENHPFFDRPLFTVGRNSNLRRFCQDIVDAKYCPEKIDSVTGKPVQLKYKQFHSLLGLMTYLDWAMVLVTAITCGSMLLESPWPTTGENLVFNNGYLQICEYIFVLAMTFELAFKVVANGLFFTPKAVVRDVGGVMTIFIYITSFWFLLWMPTHIEINSFAQLIMIFRAMRPLRIYTLVPHIRRVVVELCKGFKEICLVTILLILLMFVFASFGVQIVGGKLAACNDPTITSRANCTGVFEQKIFVTRMDVYGKNDDLLHPKYWCLECGPTPEISTLTTLEMPC